MFFGIKKLLSKSPIFFDPDIYELNRQITQCIQGTGWFKQMPSFRRRKKYMFLCQFWNLHGRLWLGIFTPLFSVLLGSIFLVISAFFFFLTKSWWRVEGTRAVKPSSFFLPICALRRWGSWKVKVLVVVVYSGNDQP